MGNKGKPFWETKTLEQMTPAEWESLCDGCGRCCLLKLVDEDGDDEVFLTRLSCRLLDLETCRCRDYSNRHKAVPDCITIDPEAVRSLSWMPKSCGYRRISESRGLAWWHPLISENPDTVHAAGISIQGWACSETNAAEEDFHRFIIPDLEDEG